MYHEHYSIPRFDGKKVVDASCSHDDEKPTDKIGQGSRCIESDTGDVYLFDEASGEWVKQFSLQD